MCLSSMNICIRVSEQTKSRLKELSKEMGISQGKLVELPLLIEKGFN